jgi:hypothetical protein
MGSLARRMIRHNKVYGDKMRSQLGREPAEEIIPEEKKEEPKESPTWLKRLRGRWRKR